MAELLIELGEAWGGELIGEVPRVSGRSGNEIAVAVEEADAPAGRDDEDIVIAGGQSLRIRVVRKLVVESRTLQATGAEVESGMLRIGDRS